MSDAAAPTEIEAADDAGALRPAESVAPKPAPPSGPLTRPLTRLIFWTASLGALIAAGVAIVLWVAEQLKRDYEAGKLKRPVVVALFGAEELGLLGSTQFAGVVTLSVVGSAAGPSVHSKVGLCGITPPSVSSLVLSSARERSNTLKAHAAPITTAATPIEIVRPRTRSRAQE